MKRELANQTSLKITANSSKEDKALHVKLVMKNKKQLAAKAIYEQDASQLSQLTQAYLNKSESNVSPDTHKTYATGITQFCDYAFDQGLNLLKLSHDEAEAYIKDAETRASISTAKVRLAAVRALYRMIKWTGNLSSNPFDEVKVSKDNTPKSETIKSYSMKEVNTMLYQAVLSQESANTELRARRYQELELALLLGSHGGLRASEMLSLNRDAIDFENSQAKVLGKGNKLRTVNLSNPLAEALKANLSEHDQDLVLAVVTNRKTLNREINKLAELSKVEPRGIHALRHTNAKTLLKNSDLETVSKHLGHASTSTTSAFYTGVNHDKTKADIAAAFGD